MRIAGLGVALLATIPATTVQAATQTTTAAAKPTVNVAAPKARTLVTMPSPSAGGAVSASTAPPTREIFGYASAGSLGDPTIGYPSWNFDLLSTVAFFAIHVRYDGKIVGDSSFSVWDSSTLTGLISTAHAHGVKVVVTITGPSNPIDFCDALYNRATTVAQIVNQVVLKGADGVNIDYEGQLRTCTSTQLGNQTNQAMLTGLAHDLRVALDAVRPGYYLSIATYSGSAAGNDGFFNIGDLNQYVDSFFVMAYDMDYYGWRTAGCTKLCMNPVSPLSTYVYNDTLSVQQYVSVVGRGKVILGLPYYGRVACVPSPTTHAYPNGGVMYAATYLGAAAVASSADVKPGTFRSHRDPTDPAGLERWDTWYDLSLGCWREMYWDDTTSLGTRYNLVNRSAIRGVGFWTLNYGGGAPELWDALSAYFKVWSAGYDMTSVPTRWVAGQGLTFNVTVTNSGTYTWPSGGSNPARLNVHFTTRPGGAKYASSWLDSNSFALPSDVAPGTSVTVPVTVNAPMKTGSMYLEATMFKNQQFWFSQAAAIPVSVAAQTWIGAYDLTAAPSEWRSGQTQNVTVTLTNRGNVPWPATGTNPVMLNLHFTTAAGGSSKMSSWLSSQSYALPNDVAPGGSVTLTVPATAPAAHSGYMYLEAELFRNKLFWFPNWGPLRVTVYGPWGGSYDLTQAPATWTTGDQQTFAVTLTNRGTQTWNASGTAPVRLNFRFTTVPGGAAKQAYWLTNQSFALPNDVAPGASVTFNVTLKAPVKAGSMYLEAQLYKNTQFWFQQWANLPVKDVLAFVASYNTCQVPTTWAPGQTRSVTLTVTNTGADAWPSSGTNPVKLDLHFTSAAGGSAASAKWLTSQVYALPNDVAPGASVSLTVNATAPTTAGQLYLEAEMFKDHELWFQQWSPSPATVGAPAFAADYNVCGAPSAWTKGQTQSFQVTLTNTGSQTWNATGANPLTLNLHFSTKPGGTAAMATWLKSYNIALAADVAPGQSVTVTVTVAAPSTAGTVYVEAQMFRDHLAWLQQWQGVAVTVS